MAPVTVQRGPVDATDRARDVSPEKWFDLTLARRLFARSKLPSDCRNLLLFVPEAEEFQMWTRTGPADLPAYLREGLGIDPAVVQWAVEGLHKLDTTQPVPLKAAVEAGQRAAQVMEQAPELPRNGEVGNGREKSSFDIVKATPGGNEATYLSARLKRDHPEIAAKVLRGEYRSIRAAALDAGIIKPTRTIPIDTPDNAVRALLRVFAKEDLQAALDAASPCPPALPVLHYPCK